MAESDPRKLAAGFFRCLKEAGEDELYLSEEAIRVVREGPSCGVSRPVGSGRAVDEEARSVADARGKAAEGAPAADPDELRKRRARALDAEAVADTIPEPDIVEAQIAIAASGAAPDMFSETTDLESAASLEEVAAIASGCERCELARGRTNVVFGEGNTNARLMFVGEAPGKDEDLSGVPFVGRAGKLLDKILESAAIERDDVYIANIIKCRPPGNRTPLSNEIEACLPYLARQYEFIKPRIICTLGLPATQTLLGMRGSMGSLRGKIYRCGDIRVIPTYHPAAALRDPKYKRPIWQDFLLIKREYERT
jgi:DNA polymerase